MQITIFSFIMSLLWFNLYIVIINVFRKKDSFIIFFSTLPLVFFLFLSILRLIFNFEIPGSIVISSRNIFTKVYDFIKMPLNLEFINIDVFQLLFFIWIIGSIVLIIDTMKKYTSFKKNLGKMSKQQSKINEEILNKILIQKRMNKKIEIIQNENISSPFITGILNGKIYIPNINFSEEEFEHIISHEINHFSSNDSLKKILIQFVKHLFWWNPLAHLFANDFNQILEIQCDLKTTVGFSEEEKVNYLEIITKIIKKNMNTKVENVNYVTVPNLFETQEIDNLKQRFRIVLNYRHKRNISRLSNIALCLLALTIFTSSYFIIIQPHYEPSGYEMYIKNNDENSFILEKESGVYEIYINNTYKYTIKSLEDLDKNLSNLIIYKGVSD